MWNAECRMSGFSSQCAWVSRSRLPMNLPCLVAADVRRLTLPQPVLREKIRALRQGSGCTSLPAYALRATAGKPRLLRGIGVGSWPQVTREL